MKTNAIAYFLGAPGRTSVLSLGGRMRQYFRARADLRRLQALDDRMLGDIGLSRSDVDLRIVRKGRLD
jgi:uncharacterized protein YjiS (DUF1127 family)